MEKVNLVRSDGIWAGKEGIVDWGGESYDHNAIGCTATILSVLCVDQNEVIKRMTPVTTALRRVSEAKY